LILTPEERRAVVALAVLLAFGQAIAWWEKREAAKPDAELSVWLTRMAELRAAEDTVPPAHATSDAGAVGASLTNGSSDLAEVSGPTGPVHPGEPAIPERPSSSGQSARSAGPSPMKVRPRTEIPPGVLETGKLRINEATAEQLESLPGVGPALAQRILAARRERPFSSPEDLLRVRGIGPRTLERLRPQIEVRPAAATAEPSDPAASAEVDR
jgi:competence ComEA-like helix-hairpin-helix protein